MKTKVTKNLTDVQAYEEKREQRRMKQERTKQREKKIRRKEKLETREKTGV